MEMVRYRKPTDIIRNTGFSKGVRCGSMKVFFKNGCPYKKNDVLMVKRKGVVTCAKVLQVNDYSLTCDIMFNGEIEKGVILFQNVIKVIV